MSTNESRSPRRLRASLYVSAFVSLTIAAAAVSQSPPGASPAQRAVGERKAIFTLIGSNFRPLGEQAAGRASLDAAEAKKRAERVAVLASMATEAFSSVSNAGQPETRAKADIWSKRADFDKAIAEFAKDAQALNQVAASSAPGSDEFKKAAQKVAENCKGCHDTWRTK